MMSMRSPISRKDMAAKQLDANQNYASAADTANKVSDEAKDYGEQIAKYIPVEVIAFYLPAIAAATSFNISTVATEVSPEYTLVLWIIFIAGIIGSFAYMYRNAHRDLVKENILNPVMRASVKAIISSFAFFIWAFYLGGPFKDITFQSAIGVLLILFFTFANPFMYDLVPFPNNNGLLSVTVGKIEQTTKGTKVVPGNISDITILNRSCENIQLGKATLYWKKNPLQKISTYELELNGTAVLANSSQTILKNMQFSESENAKTHILEIQTSKGIVKSELLKARA
jgi:hypothetical protein